MTSDQLKWFEKVFGMALDKLRLDSCARAVGSLAGAIDKNGNLTRNPLETLAALRATTHIVNGGSSPGDIAAVPVEHLGWGTHAEIYLYEDFFKGDAGAHTVNFGNLSSEGKSAITLLHELVHTLGGGHGDDSSFWNDAIYNGCFGPNAK